MSGEPVVEFARQLQDEVARIAADPEAGVQALLDAFDELPRAARRQAAEATFRALAPERQWDVLAGLFDDDELRAALAHEHRVHVARAEIAVRRAALVERVATDHVLDLRLAPAGEHLTFGLFREADVSAALPRGRASTACARRLVVRGSDEPGVVHVLEDVFNPAGGLFVTADYDEASWRSERLPAHSLVRLGSLHTGGRFEPLIHPGGRVDVEMDGDVRPGRLHAGYALIADRDLLIGTTAR